MRMWKEEFQHGNTFPLVGGQLSPQPSHELLWKTPAFIYETTKWACERFIMLALMERSEFIKKERKKEKTAHKQQPTHRLHKTPTQHLILFSLSKFWSCISPERNRTLLVFLDTLLLFRVSPLSSSYYKTKLSAGNRWSGETSTEQTERRNRARRTEKRRQRGRHTNMRLRSGEQGRTTSAKHVSCDNCHNGK